MARSHDYLLCAQGNFSMTNIQLAIQFFIQIGLILSCCRIVGVIAARFGQPQVIAEMIAGVLLGPSFFGIIFPEWQRALFPWDPVQAGRDSQSYLFPVGQLGLALYMFIVGLEFRIDIVRSKLRSALAVSVAGMVAPFVLGCGLGWLFFHQTVLFPKETTLLQAMLFLGASLCITAFPMLARIIQFKGLTGTTIGSVAIGAGAINDAAAWCLLAIVIASCDQDATHAIWNITGGIGFVAIAVFLIRPCLARIQHAFLVDGLLTDMGMSLGLVVMALGAWFTETIGLHAVFGAFVIGSIMPRGFVTRDLIARIQPLTLALLLPLFFTYSGLNTRIGLLNSCYLWGLCAVVLFAAVVGKGVACWSAASASGMSKYDSLGIGILMNTRGLMELIIINIGLQRGLISEELFTILAIMAVVTTLMTSPLFDWLVGNKGTQ
jgi:Kef-type K+ transport system membrane component KefB